MINTLLAVMAVGVGFNIYKYLQYSDYDWMPRSWVFSLHGLVVEARKTHIIGAVWDLVWLIVLTVCVLNK